MSSAERRPRVLAISSRGGHWIQLRRLRSALDGCDVTWASTDPGFAREVAPDRFVLIPEASRWDRLRLAWSVVRVLALVVRLRPHAILSTGAAPGFLALRFGRLVGARTMWIDSVANAEELSLSGRKAAGFADLALTQWSELGPPLPPAAERRKGVAYHAGAVF